MAGILLCSLIFVAWRQRQAEQIHQILLGLQEERGRIFTESLETYKQPIRSYVNTNSYWNELVDFLDTKDTKWADNSLDISSEKSIDVVFVLRKTLTEFYKKRKSNNIPDFPSDKWAVFMGNRANIREVDTFFTVSDTGDVWEVHVVPICKSSDPQHKGEVFGYLAAARCWTPTRLRELAQLNGAQLKLELGQPGEKIFPAPTSSQIRTSVVLNANSPGSRPIRLQGDFDVSLARQLERFSEETMTLFFICGMVLILAIALSLMRWVNAPLRTVIDSLQDKVSPPVESLTGREFGELGRLVTEFFENKEALREANEALEQRVIERTAALQTSLVSLQESRQRFQEVVDHTPVTIFVIGPDAKLLLLEGHGVRATRLSKEKFLGRTAYRLCGNNRYLNQRVRNVVEQGHDESFTVMVRGAAFDVRIRPLRTPEGKLDGAIGIALDVTERQRFEAVLRHQALYDTLTGLPNRTHFREELERALRDARADNSTTAILFLDLDNFKLINDTLGHEAGDGLLRALAGRLQEVVEGKGFVARLAGDEFVILLERVANQDYVEALGSQLSAALGAPISLAGRELYANGSIGIALSKAGANTSTEMLRHADVAMYRAKQSGRGRWCTFDDSMSQNLQERLELESDLRNAAIRNELMLVYQPILNLQTGDVEEVEALLRWNHPRLGLIAPYRFIHIAEKSGAIIGLDYWALRQGCEEIAAHNNNHPNQPVTLCVNLSASQFQQPSLPMVVRRILEGSGLSPSHLKLEITEGTMMQDPHGAAVILHELKSLNVSIAIDDFGTGFSSMTYLASLPLDTLKIDQSFVRLMNEQASSLAIVYAIRQLAAALDMDVTCEGIETQKQAHLLRKMGCERGQGYLYGRPMPFADLADQLIEKKPELKLAA